jgi:hypothetical protein
LNPPLAGFIHDRALAALKLYDHPVFVRNTLQHFVLLSTAGVDENKMFSQLMEAWIGCDAILFKLRRVTVQQIVVGVFNVVKGPKELMFRFGMLTNDPKFCGVTAVRRSMGSLFGVFRYQNDPPSYGNRFVAAGEGQGKESGAATRKPFIAAQCAEAPPCKDGS